VEIQQFPDAIQFATLALASPDLSDEDDALARNSRAMASIGLRDLAGLERFASDDLAAQPDSPIAALRLGDLLLAQGKFSPARAQFKSCLTAQGDDLYRCQIGYVVASQLAGVDGRAEIAATYSDKGAALADSASPHGRALAVFLGHLGGGAYRDFFLAEARANFGKPEAALTLGRSFYYLGLMGVWSDNMKFARDSFSQSASSGAVVLEAALSEGWLATLPE
jgi:tetratricopeptide (TPR) repeat protein